MLGAVFLIVHDVRDFFVFVTTFFGVSSYLLLGLVQERGTGSSMYFFNLAKTGSGLLRFVLLSLWVSLTVPIAPVERGSFYA